MDLSLTEDEIRDGVRILTDYQRALNEIDNLMLAAKELEADILIRLNLPIRGKYQVKLRMSGPEVIVIEPEDSGISDPAPKKEKEYIH